MILKPNHQRLLYFLHRDGPCTAHELNEKTFIGPQNIYIYLRGLIAAGLVIKKKEYFFIVKGDDNGYFSKYMVVIGDENGKKEQ